MVSVQVGSFSIDGAALSGLRLEVTLGRSAIRGHGVEVGGMIVGELSENRCVVVKGFVPVAIEYRFGPTFRPSTNDIESFRRAIEASDEKVIGYFRSQLHGKCSLRQEDCQLLADVFAEDSCFACVVADAPDFDIVDLHYVPAGGSPKFVDRVPLRPQRTPPPESHPEADTPPAPEKPIEPGRSPAPQPAVASVAPIAPRSREAIQVPTSPALRPLRNPPQRQELRALGIGLVAVALLGGSFWIVRRPPGEEHPTTSRSRVATVPQSKRQDENQNGPVKPDSNIGPATATREEKPSASGAKAAASIERGGSRENPAERQPHSSLERSDSTPPVDRPPPRAVAPPTGLGADADVVGIAANRPVPALQPQPSPPPPAVTPAATQPALSPETASARRTSVTETTPVAPQSTPQVLPSRQFPLPQPQSLAPVPPPSIPNRSPQMILVGVQILHQATPAIPVGVGSRIRTSVQIDVAVDVDSNGKATRARVTAARGEAAGLLVIEVLKAAELSRFSPARENGTPVAGQTVLTFVFAPGRN